MRVVPPLDITEARLTSSSAPEPAGDEVVYNASTIYDSGNIVINTTTHRRYESVRGSRATVTFDLTANTVGWPGHGLGAGTRVKFSTTGTLPTGLGAAYTDLYVVSPATDTFQVASTIGGAAIDMTGSQSGVHTGYGDPNVAHDPTTDDGSWWIDAGPTNRWAALDLLRNTGTIFPASPGAMVLTPGERIDAIALVGLVADEAEVMVTSASAGGVVYSVIEDLSTREVLDWYDYFFEPFSTKGAVAFFDVPPYSDAVITITLRRNTGLPVCGGLVIGRSVYLGRTLHDAESDALNFSTIDRQFDGTAILVPRRTVPKTNQVVRCAKSQVNRIINARAALNALPALWSGLDDQASGYFEALLILGIYKQFKVTMDQPEEALLSLELEEV